MQIRTYKSDFKGIINFRCSINLNQYQQLLSKPLKLIIKLNLNWQKNVEQKTLEKVLEKIREITSTIIYFYIPLNSPLIEYSASSSVFYKIKLCMECLKFQVHTARKEADQGHHREILSSTAI